MEIGKMNKRIIIQRIKTSPQNAYGEPIDEWETFATVWASIEPLQASEFWAQEQIQSEIKIRIRIRYLSGVTSKMRVLHGERILVIESVIEPKEAHKEMQLMCSEGVTEV